jgi:uncharacterized damage-inducible protein DinB
MQRRPADDRWSVAEILEHLAYVERALAKHSARLLDEAQAQGLGPDPEADSVLHSLDRFGVATRQGRITAGERVSPKGALQPDEALAILGDARAALLLRYRQADGLDLTRPRAPHPVLGELDLYQWLLFVAQHEARHTLQIVAALEELRGGAAPAPTA